MSRRCEWRPIVDGALADDVAAAIVRIATPLRELEPELPTLNQGSAGLAILFGYLAETGLVPDADEVAWFHLAHARRGIAERALPPELYGGFVGTAWAVEHVDGHLVGARPDIDELAGVDDAVVGVLDHPQARIFDLIAGSAGLAVYALEREQSSRRQRMLELVAARLAPIAAAGWSTPRDWLVDADAPADGWLDLGVAHGLAGAVVVLAELASRGLAREMYRDAVATLLSHRRPDGFPGTLRSDRAPSAARLAWCYGDPGVAAALCAAALVTDDAELLEHARTIAVHAANRGPETSGVVDAGLCHGSIGLAFLFQAVAIATDDATCTDAARFWVRDALARLAADDDVVIRARRSNDGTWERVPSTGFLNGAAGLGLGLLAAVTATPPAWARVLLAFPAAG